MSVCNSLDELLSESNNNKDVFTAAITMEQGFERAVIEHCRETLGKNIRVFKEDRNGTVYLNIDWDQFLKIQQLRSIDDIFIVADKGKVSPSSTKECYLLRIKNYKLNLLSNLNNNWKKALEVWKRTKNFKGKLYPTTEEYAEAKSQHLVVKTEMEIHERKRRKIYKEKEEKDPLDWDVSEMKEEKEKKRRQDPSKSEESDILKFKVTFERADRLDWLIKVDSQDAAKVIGEVLQDKFHWLLDSSMYHLEIVYKIEYGTS